MYRWLFTIVNFTLKCPSDSSKHILHAVLIMPISVNLVASIPSTSAVINNMKCLKN